MSMLPADIHKRLNDNWRPDVIIHVALSKYQGPPDPPCMRDDCPGERGWEVGYGLAGGGMGCYSWCPMCEQVVDKVEDPMESSNG